MIKFKDFKRKNILLIALILAVVGSFNLLLLFLLIGGNAGVYSWGGTMLSRSDKADSWAISANTVTGSGRRTINFSEDNLSTLRAENTNDEGMVLLKLTQGDNEKTIDISGAFSENIDTGGFLPGKIKMRVEFTKVKKLKLNISW